MQIAEQVQVMRKLADWLENYGWTVYYNQTNTDGYDTFHANTNAKPDILLKKGDYYVLLEVKPCQKHNDLLDGRDQLLKYAGEYYSGRTSYYLEPNGDPLDIDAFVLATDYSREGYLFRKEDQLGFLESTYLAKHKNMIERPISHSVTRLLWRTWEQGLAHDYYRQFRSGDAAADTDIPDQQPLIGTLMAKIKKSPRQVTDHPYFFLNSNEFVPAGCGEIYVFED